MTFQHIITPEGGKLAVEVDGKGPLVICSPGLGDTRDAYDPIAKQLVAAGYRVARVDLRGHGDSTDDFARYGDDATADDFLAVVNALGDGRPAALVGTSMSAAAATVLAKRRPELVAGLVLLGPFLRNGGAAAARSVIYLAFYRPLGPILWKWYAAKLWPGLGPQGAAERAARSTALLTRSARRWAAFHASLAADHSAVTEGIESVRAPVLVVMGDKDPDWHDPLAEAAWVVSNFRDAESLIVQGAGHAPMLERPDVVGPAVVKFRKSWSLETVHCRQHDRRYQTRSSWLLTHTGSCFWLHNVDKLCSARTRKKTTIDSHVVRQNSTKNSWNHGTGKFPVSRHVELSTSHAEPGGQRICISSSA